MDCSPPGASIHGTLQARVLEWVAVSFSRKDPGDLSGDLPNPGIEPGSPALQADALTAELEILPFGTTWMDPEGLY